MAGASSISTGGRRAPRLKCMGLAGWLAFTITHTGCQAAPDDLGDSVAPTSQLQSATDPIGTYEPTVVHDTICLKNGAGPCFGFSATGGGYGNLYQHSSGGSNWAAAGFGRGWQSSLRDEVHGGLYNPTQAGFSDDCGKPTTLTRATSVLDGVNRRIAISKFNVPLFRAGNEFDFTENEGYCDDKYEEPAGGYAPSGAQDQDGVSGEEAYGQWREVKSEFDYFGFYEDVSEIVTNGAGVMRHVFHYEYRRAPQAIEQFSSTLEDRGKLEGLTISWGPRVTDNSDFKWYHYGESSRNTLSKRYPLPTGDTKYEFLLDQDPMDPCPGSVEYCTRWPLLILATDTLISGNAVGILYPESRCNTNQFRGIHVNTDGTTTVVYEHSRFRQAGPNSRLMKASIKHAGTAVPDPTYGYWRGEWTMPLHFQYTEMFAPDRPEVVNAGATYERYSMEVYILTGTPIQIRDAAIQLRASGAMAWRCD